ncbi:MAG: type I restriction-modification system endonuclease [Planctomycetes bacterium]|nr:type I restriction-modification system endonuclease [Planctomycetota bacterium]
MADSANFGFLAVHDPLLDLLGGQAERYFADDPSTALIKLRQWGEVLAQSVAVYSGLNLISTEDFRSLLNRLWEAGPLKGADVARVFHDLRRNGNKAVHEHVGSHGDALHQLKMARKLAVWFHTAVAGNPGFKAGPFVPPQDPKKAEKAVAAELEKLRATLAAAEEAAEEAKRQAHEEARLRAEAEARARERGQDLEAALALAQEVEERLLKAEAVSESKLEAIAAQTAAEAPQAVQQRVDQARQAGDDLDLSEAETRRLIDQQLRDAGWTVESDQLRHGKGVRPQKSRNLAIAEWPTERGPADYVLFVGLRPVAVVEAKKASKDVSGSLEQAKRYSRAYELPGDQKTPGGPWGEYAVPFLYATNGRPYLRQLETKSGIWFLDGRVATNHGRALEGWHRPEELLALLEQDIEAAKAILREEPPDYLPLRDYQLAAVKAVETALLDDKRQALLAMATGSGKTRTCIGLIYRLIKAKLFRRILFLVDRTSLGIQATNAFKDLKIEGQQTFTQIYDLKEIGTLKPDPDTKVHVTTIQSMVRRLLDHPDGDAPSIGTYDCIVVDECHRGYNLDREMTDAELEFRSEADYISKFTRVLDHFDAVKIGLTATPALHTCQLFGDPVYEYSYRQAVIDGYLVDHEPPIRIVTKLSEDGIHWKAGEEITVLDSRSQQLDLFHSPDDVDVEIQAFNTKVQTENFNRVVCQTLAKHIDPTFDAKTLVFCVTDVHADMVVKLLKEALAEEYGEVDDDAVQKITGKADKPLEKIRRFKNERLPNIAVTVDLLSTGIDVPPISNLVFLRRVRSRILYAQMLGRATRKCDEIGKERFRIFDAVDLYAALDPYSDMRPVVTNPTISFAQLVEEVVEVPEGEARQEFLEQLVAKLQRKKRTINQGDNAQNFETLAGTDLESLVQQLRAGTPEEAAQWFAEHTTVADFLDSVTGDPERILISDHADEFVRTERGYGDARKPEDYLEGFKKFLEENLDRLPALTIVMQRPRDLTRQQLRELRLALDQAGYSETALQVAWHEKTNAEIAASIIGFVRHETLDSPLLSFDERVDRAVRRIKETHTFTTPQRKWLERIAKQIKEETVVDHAALDRGQFKTFGGFKRLNKVFDGKLDELLKQIQESIWADSAA